MNGSGCKTRSLAFCLGSGVDTWLMVCVFLFFFLFTNVCFSSLRHTPRTAGVVVVVVVVGGSVQWCGEQHVALTTPSTAQARDVRGGFSFSGTQARTHARIVEEREKRTHIGGVLHFVPHPSLPSCTVTYSRRKGLPAGVCWWKGRVRERERERIMAARQRV